jgi:GT2 family glycosyltransferase/glycosyltransferase involved in cell wall biosynthesis
MSNLKAVVGRYGRYIYRSLPLPHRFKYFLLNTVYLVVGRLGVLDGIPNYESWKRHRYGTVRQEGVRGPVAVENYAAELGRLRFELVENPRVSVIIPAYGRLDHTLMCLRSIADNLPQAGIEVIVAEDASGDQDILRLASVPGLRFIINPVNLGFLRSCNHAAAQARGEYLYFLNNDTEVTPGWLDSLLALFAADPDCGMAGSKLVYPDGALQEAGGIIWQDATGMNLGKFDDPRRLCYNYVKEADYISGASILVPTALFRELGAFDERYVPAYYEDTDLAFQIRAAGKKVLYQPASCIIHYEGISHGTDTGSGIKAYQLVNQQKFLEKWKHVLQSSHFPRDQQMFHARDRSGAKKTILIIDHDLPQPDQDAGSRVMWCFIRLFLQMGLNVKFWSHRDWPDEIYAQPLQQAGVELFYGEEYAGRFKAWIREHGSQLDYVLLSRPLVAMEYMALLRQHSPAKRLYYGHDLHFERMLAEGSLKNDRLISAGASVMKRLEMKLWQDADVVYYPSDSETATVKSLLPAAVARTVPLFFYDTSKKAACAQTPLVQRRDLVLVGGFRHAPNIDAAQWFVADILPLIQAVHPDVHFTLIGSQPTEEVLALASPSVTVTGHVSEEALQDHYAGARVVVVPLRFGAGVKGKVLEAMHYCVPVVTTPVGLQGLAGLDAIMSPATEARDFADKVLRLLEDDALWQQQADAGYAYIGQNFSLEAMQRIFALDIEPGRA